MDPQYGALLFGLGLFIVANLWTPYPDRQRRKRENDAENGRSEQ